MLRAWRVHWAICGAMLSLATATATAALPLTPASADSPTIKVYGSTVTIRPDSALPPGGVDASVPAAASLEAAQNEFESFQIAIKTGATAIPALRVDPSGDLTRDGGGGTIPTSGASSAMTVYREAFYNITNPPGTSDAEGGLGRWPDALIPAIDPYYGETRNAFQYAQGPNSTETAWIDIHVPAGQLPGTYHGTVLVKDGGTTLQSVQIKVAVRQVNIDSTSHLDSLFLTDYRSECDAHTGNPFCNFDEDKRWTLQALYERAALENHVTIANPYPFGNNEAPTAGDRLNKFNQYILPLINGSGDGAGTLPRRLVGARMTTVTQLWQCIPAPNCLATWKSVAEADGFVDRFVVYACDEPSDAPEASCRWVDAPARLNAVQAAWPGVSRLVTTSIAAANSHGITNGTDVLSPNVNDMDGWAYCTPIACNSFFEGNQRNVGPNGYDSFLDPANNPAGTAANRLWIYSACTSAGCDTWNDTSQLWRGWPGFAIDEPAAQSRAMGWMAYLYSATGELYYHTTRELATAWNANGQDSFGLHGDGTLFYPGTVGRIGGSKDIPIESIRLKRIRDGYEDNELLRILSSAPINKAAEAKQIVEGIFGPARTLAQQSPGNNASAMHNINDSNANQAAFDSARTSIFSGIGNVPPPPPTCNGLPATLPDLSGTPGDDVIIGTANADTIDGEGGNDTICGLAGFDTIRGGLGGDFMDAGPGGGGANYGPASGPVTVNLATGQASGEGTDTLSNFSEVYGSQYNDNLIGRDDNIGLEFLAGEGGNDQLSSGAGNDRIDGGDGNDQIDGGAGGDTLNGDQGGDTILSRDGTFDAVNCGTETDSVTADTLDSIAADCEMVDIGPIVLGPIVQSHTLLVSRTGAGSGTVTSSSEGISCGAACSHSFTDRTQVTLSAQAAAGSTFTGWSGGGCEGTGSCVVTITSDTTVSANFARATPPPDTKIRRALINGNKRKASFFFTGSSEAAPLHFLCKLDRGQFAPCASPKTYKHLDFGRHTFHILAIDPAGNADPTPASRRFKVVARSRG
jgi:Ca2+-binding RTX toxin-like protein